MKVTPRAVPFVGEDGDVVVKEQVKEIPNHEPLIFRVKATPRPTAEVKQMTPLTFLSPLELENETYLPVVKFERVVTRRILVLVYQGEAQAPGIPSPKDMAQQMTDDLYRASVWHGDPNGAHSFNIGLIGSSVTLIYTYPPIQANGYLNVPSIYTQNNVCARVQAGEVDEVWIYVDGKPGGHIYADGEFVANGPYWSILTPGIQNVPSCSRQIFTLFLNFDRDESEALEAWSHSLEHTIEWFTTAGYQMCDSVPPNPANDPVCNGVYPYSWVYGFTAQPAPENSYIGVCGSVHWPPNRPVGSGPYQWREAVYYPSRCQDWDWGDPTGTVQVNRETWGQILGCQMPDAANECYQRAYLIWWMQHIPSIGNTSHGRTGALRPNWLSFRLQP